VDPALALQRIKLQSAMDILAALLPRKRGEDRNE
jgi:hypothetical protein